jgi:hypothetical protein
MSHVTKHKANLTITFSPVMHAIWSNKLISLDLIVLIILGKHYKLHSSSYTFFFKFPVTFVLRSKYHFHHPLLKHPKSTSSLSTQSYASYAYKINTPLKVSITFFKTFLFVRMKSTRYTFFMRYL